MIDGKSTSRIPPRCVGGHERGAGFQPAEYKDSLDGRVTGRLKTCPTENETCSTGWDDAWWLGWQRVRCWSRLPLPSSTRTSMRRDTLTRNAQRARNPSSISTLAARITIITLSRSHSPKRRTNSQRRRIRTTIVPCAISCWNTRCRPASLSCHCSTWCWNSDRRLREFSQSLRTLICRLLAARLAPQLLGQAFQPDPIAPNHAGR